MHKGPGGKENGKFDEQKEEKYNIENEGGGCAK